MPKNKQPWYKFEWRHTAKKISMETIETALVVLYIAYNLAAFLVLFDFVPASTTFKRIVGALAFGFSIFAMIAFINKGVKHQSNLKRN